MIYAVTFRLSYQPYFHHRIFLLACSFNKSVFHLILAQIIKDKPEIACHGSYSCKEWIIECMGLTMNALGSNAFREG